MKTAACYCYSMEASNCQNNVMIAYKTYDISDDNNYALEEYGEGSMCFEQGGPWQQKSCTMLKQWQRYGAGTVRVTVRLRRGLTPRSVDSKSEHATF